METEGNQFLLKEYDFCADMIRHNDQLWHQMLKLYITVISALLVGGGTFLKFAFENAKTTMPYEFPLVLLFVIAKVKLWFIPPVGFISLLGLFYLFYLRSNKKKNVEYIRAVNNIRKVFANKMGTEDSKGITLPTDSFTPKYFNIFGTYSIYGFLVILVNTFFFFVLATLITLPRDPTLILKIDIQKYISDLLLISFLGWLFQLVIFIGYLLRQDRIKKRFKENKKILKALFVFLKNNANNFLNLLIILPLIIIVFFKINSNLQFDLKKLLISDLRLKPINFVNTGMYDPKDSSSTFCYIDFELKNYGKLLAKDIDVKEIIISSETRGAIEVKNYLKSEALPLYLVPNKNITFRIGFVLNPNYHIKRYDEGIESLDSKVWVSYKDEKDKDHIYKSLWSYKNKIFYPKYEEGDIIQQLRESSKAGNIISSK